MNQILSDEEITLIVRECAKGSAINRDGSTSHRIARTIEQAILAKLGSAEPVCWVTPGRGSGWRMRFDPPTTDTELGWTPLYEHSPAPNAATLIDISDEDSLRFLQRVLEGDATQADRDDARELISAIRKRIRKSARSEE